MGVMLQAFYWDCPREDQKEYKWWNTIRAQVPSLAKVGFTALWLPPVHKAANLGGPSMGYDPYDYYDLGEFDQKGSLPTWFGSRRELLALIADAHRNSMSVIADVVINHNSGADAAGGQSHQRPVTLDAFQAEERQVPAQLGMFSSQHV